MGNREDVFQRFKFLLSIERFELMGGEKCLTPVLSLVWYDQLGRLTVLVEKNGVQPHAHKGILELLLIGRDFYAWSARSERSWSFSGDNVVCLE